jgi:hypothetical protein
MSALLTFSLVMFGISMLSLVIQLINRKKIVEAINKYSPDKKQRTIERYTTVAKIYKAVFLMTPLYLFSLYAFHKYAPAEFKTLLSMIILIYIFTLIDYFYRKSIIKLCGLGNTEQTKDA